MISMTEQTFDQNRLQPFSLQPDGAGGHQVTLAGQDITKHVRGVQVDMSASTPYADVLLHVAPSAAMHPQIDVLARVVVADEPDIATAVTRFLSAIDPQALEDAALNRPDLDPGRNGLTKSMLTQLIEWANGRP